MTLAIKTPLAACGESMKAMQFSIPVLASQQENEY